MTATPLLVLPQPLGAAPVVNNQAGRIAMDLFLMPFITSVLGAIVACYIYLVASKVEVPAELKELTKQIVAYCIGVGSGIGLIHRSAKP